MSVQITLRLSEREADAFIRAHSDTPSARRSGRGEQVMSDTTELIAELRRWPTPVGTVPSRAPAVAISDAADALEAQQARINAVRAVHAEKRGERAVGYTGGYANEPVRLIWQKYTTCAGCSADWPCATVRALSGGVSDTEQPNQVNGDGS